MKKVSLIIICLSFLFMTVSCNSNLEDEIIENLQTMENTTEQQSNDNDNDNDEFDMVPGYKGIVSKDYVINDNKFYFVTKRKSKYSNPMSKLGKGVEMISYIDFDTGYSSIICPDPLCEHEEDGNCKYTEFEEMYFTEKGVFYSMRVLEPDYVTRKNAVMEICKIDLNKDTVKSVCATQTFSADIIGLDGDKLYYYERIEETLEKKTVYHYHLYCIDTKNDTTTSLGKLPDDFEADFALFAFIFDGEVYYHTKSGKLMKTDWSFSETVELFAKGSNMMPNLFIDTNTGEIYYNLINQSAHTGSIYVYKDGVSEKLEMPHDEIYTFTLTESDIYYTVYDPIYYGINPSIGETYDYSGGKVYKTSRTEHAEAELVYDCAGEYVICNAESRNIMVFGDDLYFEEIEITKETVEKADGTEIVYVYFNGAINVNKIRINLTTGELTRYQFD